MRVAASPPGAIRVAAFDTSPPERRVATSSVAAAVFASPVIARPHDGQKWLESGMAAWQLGQCTA